MEFVTTSWCSERYLSLWIYILIGLTLDSNAQVTYIYCASNIYLKFFLCATYLRKWHIYEIANLLMTHKFINLSMHLYCKFKQSFIFLFIYYTTVLLSIINFKLLICNPTECINSRTCYVDSPTILAYFRGFQSCKPLALLNSRTIDTPVKTTVSLVLHFVGQPIRYSRPVYCKSYFF